MDSAKEYPKYPIIELEYVAVNDALDSVPYIYSVAEAYAQSRKPEEGAYAHVETSDSGASVKLGRKVLVSTSYAGIVEKAEEMHREIEASEILRQNDASIASHYVGYQLLGNLPEQE